MEKIKLGIIKEQIKETQSYQKDRNHLSILGERIAIEKHKWDCDWYWGFGYIGNGNLHTHCNLFIKELLWSDVKEVFSESIFKSDKDFWIFKDLLKQAYALKECAEIYRLGGHCVTNDITKVIKSKDMENKINGDLKRVLDMLWNFLKSLKK